MSSAREEILSRVRAALVDLPASVPSQDEGIERTYRQHAEASAAEIAHLFTARVSEYRAAVIPVMPAQLPAAIAAACSRRAVRQLLVPVDIPDAWLPNDIAIVRDTQLSTTELDRCDGVLTGCACGIAQTGTIVLAGGTLQGRRAVSLIPDYHLCVVRSDQLVELVPEAIRRLHPVALEGSPITLISGPSATSDIELNRVEGVHGPRILDVLLVG